ncbi:hypothetical protein LTR85_010201 [Meristemomyces frigidus]|nr:hypothetical protein LTR85_010201 [Meristemomyces frigidus]
MGEIYMRSEGNLIDLGDDDPSLRLALHSIGLLAKEMCEDVEGPDSVLLAYVDGGIAANTAPAPDIDETALMNFFARAWFQLFISPQLFDSDGLHAAAHLWQFVDVKNGKGRWPDGRNTDMTALAALSQNSNASERKDRIFAVLGLLEPPPTAFAEEDSLLIKPDYTKTVQEIYRDATRFAIRESGHLHCLRATNHRSDAALVLDGFPSWAFRLDQLYDEAFDAEMFDLHFHADSHETLYGGNTEASFAGADVLSVAGMFVSTVSRISEVFSPGVWEDDDKLMTLLRSVKEMVGLYADPLELADVTSVTGEWMIESQPDRCSAGLALTLMAGQKGEGGPPTSENIAVFGQYIDQCMSTEHSVGHGDSRGTDYQRSPRRVLESACRNRRVFVDDKGQIGLGPRATMEGDCLAILFSSSTPTLLRWQKDCPNEVRYKQDCGHIDYMGHQAQYVGPAYVHSLMQGLWVDLSKSSALLEDMATVYELV